jgi:hypothetical protein
MTELLTTVVVLPSVYTAVTWHWIYMSHMYKEREGACNGAYTCNSKLSCNRKEAATTIFSMISQNYFEWTEERHDSLRIELLGLFWILSIVLYVEGKRRWIESKTSPIALYNVHHRQNPFKSVSE